jgi:hypothetical protein
VHELPLYFALLLYRRVDNATLGQSRVRLWRFVLIYKGSANLEVLDNLQAPTLPVTLPALLRLTRLRAGARC